MTNLNNTMIIPVGNVSLSQNEFIVQNWDEIYSIKMDNTLNDMSKQFFSIVDYCTTNTNVFVAYSENYVYNGLPQLSKIWSKKVGSKDILKMSCIFGSQYIAIITTKYLETRYVTNGNYKQRLSYSDTEDILYLKMVNNYGDFIFIINQQN